MICCCCTAWCIKQWVMVCRMVNLTRHKVMLRSIISLSVVAHSLVGALVVTVVSTGLLIKGRVLTAFTDSYISNYDQFLLTLRDLLTITMSLFWVWDHNLRTSRAALMIKRGETVRLINLVVSGRSPLMDLCMWGRRMYSDLISYLTRNGWRHWFLTKTSDSRKWVH